MAADPDSLDPDKLPPGAIKQIDGRIAYKDSFYDKNGKRISSLDEAMRNPAEAIKTINDATTGTWLEPIVQFFPRAGLVVLGAAIIIIGVAMLISGTKTAELVKSAIPIAGKVL